jgi:hypothetical protein
MGNADMIANRQTNLRLTLNQMSEQVVGWQ